jgi:hypothetical protein
MFPITTDKLSLFKIADYWSREIQPPASRDELLALLEGAWWRGEISGDSATTRLQFLKNMFKLIPKCDAPRIVFVAGGEAGPPTYFELPNGSVSVDVRPRVPVPSTDTDTWNEDSCAEAFQALAGIEEPSSKHYWEFSPGIDFIELTRDEFIQWLGVRGIDIPTFWGRLGDTTTPLKNASNDMILKAISDVYDLAEANHTKPPNLNELPLPVLDRLTSKGFKTSANQIKKLGGCPEFHSRRGKVGRTLSRKGMGRARPR